MKNKNKGLTLIELLAVIAIIAILFVLLIPQISSAIDKAKENGLLIDFRTYEQAATTYFMETKKEDRSVIGFNKYLEKELRFEVSKNLLSNKKHVYDEPYYIGLEEQGLIRIYTLKNRGKASEKMYDLFISEKDGEITSWTIGLNNNINVSDVKKSGDFEYVVIKNKGIEIVNYLSANKNVVIPSTIEGLPVVSIRGTTDTENKSFRNKGIESVVIPDTVKYIGYQAFRLNNLTTVTLPSSLEVLADAAFRENKLAGALAIPNKVKSILPAAFKTNELTSVTMGDEVKVIKTSAFEGNKISTLRLSNSLVRIEASVFIGNKLTAVTIPSTVEYIGASAFRNNLLTTVTIPAKVKTIEISAFTGNPMTNYRILGNPTIDSIVFPTEAVRQ